MFELLTWLTGLVVVSATIRVYVRERDPLHPLMFLGPLFAYSYCVSPLILFYGARLDRLFPEPERLEYAQLVFLAGVSFFTIGSATQKVRRLIQSDSLHVVDSIEVGPEQARRMMYFGILLGCLGILAYLTMTSNVGGFVQAYSSPKGGGYAPSGYIGEGPLLVYPAIILIAMSARRRGIEWWQGVIALCFAAPQLIHGILGGRRGPLFLVLATLFLSYFIARGLRPSRKTVISGVLAIGVAVLVVWAHRQQVYLGSDPKFEGHSILERLLPKEEDMTGDTYVYGAGSILNARFHGNYGWGKIYFVTLFVRPIPRQIWPTKYEDTIPVIPREIQDSWRRSLGWIPLAGSASGFIADAYGQFGLGCLVVAYLMGLFCGYCWKKSVLEGGVWQIIYMEVLILGIYLPAQSFSAFWYRMLFMGVPTWLVWKYYIVGHRRPMMDQWPSMAVMEREIERKASLTQGALRRRTADSSPLTKE